MKNYLLILLLSVYATTVFADERDVQMETSSTTPVTRSLIQKPSVKVDDETFQLSIRMTALTESFTVYVYDEKGFVVYQDNVITDGTNHQYLLPNLDFGNYSITIENDKRAFKGNFDI